MNPHLSKEQVENLTEWLSRFNEQLTAQRITHDDAIYWKTLETDPKDRRKSYYTEDTTLYNGNGGIVLYLLSMYKYSGEIQYLTLAKQGAQRLLQTVQDQKNNHFDLYTGKTGLYYVLSELYDATAEHSYLETAVKQILQNEQHFRDHYSDDLLSGNAGNMLVLARLFKQTNEPGIKDLLLKCFDDLIDNIYLSKHGVKWRYRPNYIDSLCGLSHGAAGIGFVLIEIGQTLKASGVTWLGEQAFAYEDQYYMSESFTWPDFRIHPEKLAHPEAVTEPDKLMKGEEVAGWAHGSVGIALSRLRAYIHTGNQVYLGYVKAIADQVVSLSSDTINFSQTNGHGANAYFLACAGYNLDDKSYTNKSYEIIRSGIQLKSSYGYLPSGWDAGNPDLSIFMGETGFAVCILRLLSPETLGDVVLPSLRSTRPNAPIHDIHFPDQKAIVHRLYNKYFPTTAKYVNKLPSLNQSLTVYAFFNALGSEISFDDNVSIREEVLHIEKNKMALEVRTPNFMFLSECYQRIHRIEPPFDTSAKFILNEFTELVETSNSNQLIVKYRYGVENFVLSPFTLMLIKRLNTAATIDDLHRVLEERIGTADQNEQIKTMIAEQLKQLYEHGMIRQVD